jgi:hypothetical protein
MGRAAMVHPNGGVREALGELTDAARVIQMDMSQHDVGELVGGHSECAERRGDRFDGRARSGLDQCRLGGLEEVGGGVASFTPHERVDRRDSVGDGEDDGRELLHRPSLAGVVSVAAGRVGPRKGGEPW